MIALLVTVLLQSLPPPAGALASAWLFSPRGHTDVILALPTPAPAQDCNCGVPASPRGPR